MQNKYERQADPCADNTIAVVITFNPDNRLEQLLEGLQGQIANVVIVDNNSANIINLFLRHCRVPCEIINNRENLGIAAALNQGLKWSMEMRAVWTLLLDQDSIPDSNLIGNLSSFYNNYHFTDRVGIIAANSRSFGTSRPLVRSRRNPEGFFETKTVVTSGTLLSNYAYKTAGPFREDFFIEGVDLEYCLRLRRCGFKVLMSCNPLMTHSTGKGLERKFLGRVLVVDDHVPWRYYMRLRNYVRIVREYFFCEPLWVFCAFFAVLKMTLKILLFEKRRMEKLALMCVGAWDACVRPRRCLDAILPRTSG